LRILEVPLVIPVLTVAHLLSSFISMPLFYILSRVILSESQFSVQYKGQTPNKRIQHSLKFNPTFLSTFIFYYFFVDTTGFSKYGKFTGFHASVKLLPFPMGVYPMSST
jgi:hypothetical protein